MWESLEQSLKGLSLETVHELELIILLASSLRDSTADTTGPYAPANASRSTLTRCLHAQIYYFARHQSFQINSTKGCE